MNIKALIITISTITLTLFVAFFAAYGFMKFVERLSQSLRKSGLWRLQDIRFRIEEMEKEVAIPS